VCVCVCLVCLFFEVHQSGKRFGTSCRKLKNNCYHDNDSKNENPNFEVTSNDRLSTSRFPGVTAQRNWKNIERSGEYISFLRYVP